MMMRWLPLLLILCAPALSLAQEDSVAHRARPNRIGLGVDLLETDVRDEAGSPVAYHGLSWPFRFFYRYDGEWSHHWVSLLYAKTGINAGPLRSAITRDSSAGGEELMSHTIDYSQRALQYGYSHYITDIFDGRGALYLGGLWDNLLFFRYYNYGYRAVGESDPNILTWDGIFTLNVLASADYHFDRDRSIALAFYLPAVAYIFRPRYAVQDDELIKIDLDNFSRLNSAHSHFATLNDFVQLNARLLYQQSLSELFDLQILYTFSWYRYGEPRLTTAALNAIGASVLFKF